MTLNQIQFAKDHDLLDALIENEVRTQAPMLIRVGKLIEKTGNQELALQAITDRTACFYQLVDRAYREPGSITSPPAKAARRGPDSSWSTVFRAAR